MVYSAKSRTKNRERKIERERDHFSAVIAGGMQRSVAMHRERWATVCRIFTPRTTENLRYSNVILPTELQALAGPS